MKTKFVPAALCALALSVYAATGSAQVAIGAGAKAGGNTSSNLGNAQGGAQGSGAVGVDANVNANANAAAQAETDRRASDMRLEQQKLREKTMAKQKLEIKEGSTITR
jgi:hypothetical protein